VVAQLSQYRVHQLRVPAMKPDLKVTEAQTLPGARVHRHHVIV
jgi:hypothetical protein